MTQIDVKLARGGLVTDVSAINADPGSAAELLNYEVDMAGGFRRIGGYERFDGRPPPSSGRSDPWEWDLAQGGTSPDGVSWGPLLPTLVSFATSESELFTTSSSEPFMVPAEEGTFVTLSIPLYGLSLSGGVRMKPGFAFSVLTHGDPTVYSTELEYSSQQEFLDAIIGLPGISFAEVVGDQLILTSTIPLDPDTNPRIEVVSWVVLDYSDTEEGIRENTLPPPGHGPIYGITTFKGRAICCRNFDEGGSDSRIYYSSSNGWEEIPTPPRAGNAIYSFVEYNFTGDPDRVALYGADGKNKAFEIKGNPGSFVYTEIDIGVQQGNKTYYPKMLAAHAQHLFMSFDGGWVQYSGIGDPFSDDPNDGAGGIAYPDDVTNLVPLKDNALAITTRDNLFILYGTSEPLWQSTAVAPQGDGVGAQPKTLVNAAGTFFVDRGGIFNMSAVPDFGNFSTSALSRPINSLFSTYSRQTVGAVALRKSSVYRVFFTGGNIISMTFSGSELLGFGYSKLNVNPVVVGYGMLGDNPSSLTEEVLIGGDDGMVYRMDSGNSFDGEEIPATIRFHFHNGGNLRQFKRWRKAVFEIKTDMVFDINTNALFDYGSTSEALAHQVFVEGLKQAGGIWDVDNWGEFLWSGNFIGEGEMRIDGHGRSVSLMLYCKGKIPSFRIEGYSVHFSPRRLAR